MNFILPSAPVGKAAGQFFTPDHVARSLVNWVIRSPGDKLLEPSCGDGSILKHHTRCRGIEREPYAAWQAKQTLPNAEIDNCEFFSWASTTVERFPCAAGNPPFIRYQNFKGIEKQSAQSICEREGVQLVGLSSSWASFVIATASLLERGGRMAFVVPAEIGHAPYATLMIEYLLRSFAHVHVVAIREKLFPRLSEDCWLLYCDGRGGHTGRVHFTALERFEACLIPPPADQAVDWKEILANWRGRLRPLILSLEGQEAYLSATREADAVRLGDFATVGIGYVTGDNDFFHLRPSEIKELGIPEDFLVPTVRRGQNLIDGTVDSFLFDQWVQADQPCFLLRIPPACPLPQGVADYLASDAGLLARARYKCRIRQSWFTVPGVTRPDFFLQYMSGATVQLAKNELGASCTNSLLAVHVQDYQTAARALKAWSSPITKLSCELEGHPLGGGMLKLEPGEARRIVFSATGPLEVLESAITKLKRWRHTRIA